jgi:hypothetical protein
MQRKNVRTYVPTVIVVLQIMINTRVGIEKYQSLTYMYNVVGQMYMNGRMFLFFYFFYFYVEGFYRVKSSNVQQYLSYKVHELVGPPNVSCH